jgi:hypothetical protein
MVQPVLHLLPVLPPTSGLMGAPHRVSVLCAGVYTVTVTDSLGCSASASATVTNGPAISGTTSINMPLCFGDINGQACFTPTGGTPPYTYQWAIGNTTACITNIPAGLYSLTVTDSIGCTGQVAVTVNQPAPLMLMVNAINASCASCTDGSASALPSGGVIPYTYLWSTGSVFPSISNLPPGVYTCCVTDMNACVACDTFSVNFASGINDPSDYSFVMSPNPFDELLTISVTDPANLPAHINLYDISGRLVMQAVMEKENYILNTDQLDAGTYLVEILGNGFTENRTLIKNRR